MATETPAADAPKAAAPKAEAQGGGKGGKGSGKTGGKKGKGGAQASRITEKAEEKLRRGKPARLRTIYDKEIKPKLQQELGLKNPMEIPKVSKITINMGLGEATANPKILDAAVEELALITGQMPVVTRAKKSIATFKLRQDQKIGCMVTLRKDAMFEFLDRLISFALPRVRDFKGVSNKAFDGRGNYTLGIREGVIFPEASFEGATTEKPKGMNITIVTTAKTDEQARTLLRHLGMPFRN